MLLDRHNDEHIYNISSGLFLHELNQQDDFRLMKLVVAMSGWGKGNGTSSGEQNQSHT